MLSPDFRWALYGVNFEKKNQISTLCIFVDYNQAGYYIGMGCRVVLCVERIPENAVISSEEVGHHKVVDI